MICACCRSVKVGGDPTGSCSIWSAAGRAAGRAGALLGPLDARARGGVLLYCRGSDWPMWPRAAVGNWELQPGLGRWWHVHQGRGRRAAADRAAVANGADVAEAAADRADAAAADVAEAYVCVCACVCVRL